LKKYERLQKIIESAEEDVHKFYKKGNKSAGVRVRKSMQEVKKIAHAIRKEILEKRKNSL
jgi:vacuolar-type H+-ATPase subunit H